MTRTRRFVVRFTSEDRSRSIYQYVPFEIDDRATGVGIEYAYARRGGAVVDLGLFDPHTFRGWSGGARSSAVVTPAAATPGYLTGPLTTGRWSVILGLHRVPADGITVTLVVDDDPSPPAPSTPPPPRRPPADRPPPRSLPATPGHRWVAADLHTHTQHSDGALTIDELAHLAAGRGVGVLAVTDHNTVSHHPLLAAAGEQAGIFLLPGQEVTTADGHANCFGDVGWIDFRDTPQEWLKAAESRDAVMSINHPVAGDCAWTYPEVPPAPLIEIWHHTWDRRSLQPLEWFQRHNAFVVGGSDFHDHGAGGLPGAPTTWLEVPDDPDALDVATVLAAVAGGTTTVAAHPQSPCLVRVGDDLVACDADGLLLVGSDGRRRRILAERERLPAGDELQLLVDDTGLIHALSL